MPLHLDLANALQGEAAVANAPAFIPGEAVIASDGAKARIARFVPCFDPSEERGEGPVQAAKWIPHRRAAHVGRPEASCANRRQLPKLLVEGDRPVPAPPGVSPLFQSRVVELTRKAKLDFKSEPQTDRGVDPIPVGALDLGVISHASPMLHLLCDKCLSKRAVRGLK